MECKNSIRERLNQLKAKEAEKSQRRENVKNLYLQFTKKGEEAPKIYKMIMKCILEYIEEIKGILK